MESSSGDAGESTEDIPAGSKRSKLKSLRTRLFRKSKRTGEERHAKLSQSARDVTAAEELGSDDDLACSHGVMGSRAFSHDSIFLDDEVLTDTEPARVLSQENVHSKIKALQMKLQQQKMHLGPPPLVLPIRRPDDVGRHLGDDGSAEVTGSDVTVFSKNTTQASSPPLSPGDVPKHPSRPLPASVAETALDLTSPARFTPCLDTSAARHRMSVKPRNQRASTKKRVTTTDSRIPSYSPPNNADQSESVNEEELPLCEPDKVETDRGDAAVINTAQHVPSKSPEVEASEASAKSSSLSSQVLRPKPQKPAGAASSERPHSSFIESELKSRREAGFEVQVMSYEKRNMLKKTGMTEDSSVSSSTVTFRPSTVVPQEVQDEKEPTTGLKRPAPGSGSFHFSVAAARDRDAARPRSSSFVGTRQQAEAKHEGGEDKSSSSLREKEELRGSLFAVGRPKSSVLQREKRGSLRKLETPSSASQNEEVKRKQEEVERSREELERSREEVKRSREEVERSREEVKRSREEVEEAVEAQEEVQEEEGKVAFGVKLRATTQSRRFQRDLAPIHLIKQEVSEHVVHTSQKPPTSVSSAEVRVTDPAPSGFSIPVKNNLPPAGDSHVRPAEAPRAASSETAVTEPPPQPQTAPSDVSWMSLALEKTRSLQQLFTSRFPRDFAGAARPTNQTEPQASASPPPTVSPAPSKAFADAQTPKQTGESQLSSLRSCTQTESSSHLVQSHATPQQPPWSNRVLQKTSQPKSTTVVSTTAAPPPPLPPPGGEGPSSSERRAVRGGSVSMRATAFLEKRAEKTTPTLAKEVDLKKVQSEAQTLDESPASAKTTPVSIENTKPEGRHGLKPAESTPTERPHEDKWIRKNVATLSSPSSSPAQSTVLQSMSVPGQPSWMELAKRKSMAWSDKTMD